MTRSGGSPDHLPSDSGCDERLEVGYELNEHGYLQQVSNAANEDEVYWSGIERNADGALTRERLGNGVQTDTGYDDQTGLLRNLAAYGHGGDLIKMSLDYDPVRNVKYRDDLATGRKETYGYDKLNRLGNWQATDGEHNTNTTYGYDLAGNLETETVAGQQDRDVTYRYGQNGAPKHALTSRNADRYDYDDAGRQIIGPKRTIEYNRFNLPTVLTWESSHSDAPSTPTTPRVRGSASTTRDRKVRQSPPCQDCSSVASLPVPTTARSTTCTTSLSKDALSYSSTECRKSVVVKWWRPSRGICTPTTRAAPSL